MNIPSSPSSRRGSFVVIDVNHFGLPFDPEHFSSSIGIEPNPGPKTKKTSTALVVVAPSVSAPSKSKPRQRPAARASSRRNRQPRSSNTGGAKSDFLKQYIRTLNSPFQYPGVRLGFDCMVPSKLEIAYTRGSFVPNPDGSFMIGTLSFGTTSNNIVGISTTTIGATAVWNYSPPTNNSDLVANVSQFRIVSGGLRITARSPETSAAGILFSNSSPMDATTLPARSCANISSLIDTQFYPGKNIEVQYRPSDNRDFEFVYSSASTSVASYQGVIGGQGWPVGTTIYYEVVYHLEGLHTFDSIPTSSDEAPGGILQSIAHYFPSIEQFYQSAVSLMGPDMRPSSEDYMFGARQLYDLYVGNDVASIRAKHRRSRVHIEEIKDDH